MKLTKNAVTFCFILFVFCASSESLLSDSLQKLLAKERVDTSRAKIGYKLAGYYLNRGNADSCLRYVRMSFDLCKKQNFKKGLARGANILGQVNSYMGYADSAIYYFTKSMNYYRDLKDVSNEASMLNNLGIVYKSKGNIPKSLDYYFLSLKIKEQLHDSESIANSCQNIGQLYNDANDSTSALKYFRRAMTIRRAISDSSGLASSLITLGIFHEKQNRFELAKQLYAESLKISEIIQEEESIAIASYNLGNIYYAQKKIEECIALFRSSLELSRKNKNTKGVVICLERLGGIFLDKGELKKAIVLLEEANNVARQIDVVEELGGLNQKLSEAYEKNGDTKNALLYLKYSIKLNDSLFNAENIRKLTSEGLKYEHEKEKLVALKEQEKKEAVAQASAFKKNIIISITILFLVIISFFSYTIFKKLKENRKQKLIIEEQQSEMIASINYAKRIQYALLAQDDLLKNNLSEHFILFKPKDIVSGDFYWATVKNEFFYVAVCDCTGHGVPGAFMSLLSINFLNEAINEKNITSPGEIFNHVRKRLIENMDGGRDGMDALLLKIPLNKKSIMVEYAAANNVPLLIRENNIIHLQKDKMPVGLGENLNSFNTFSIETHPEDSLYLYTDGFADQFGGPKGKKFMYKQLDQLLLSHSNKSITLQKETLQAQFVSWKGELEQVDDICVLGINF